MPQQLPSLFAILMANDWTVEQLEPLEPQRDQNGSCKSTGRASLKKSERTWHMLFSVCGCVKICLTYFEIMFIKLVLFFWSARRGQMKIKSLGLQVHQPKVGHRTNEANQTLAGKSSEAAKCRDLTRSKQLHLISRVVDLVRQFCCQGVPMCSKMFIYRAGDRGKECDSTQAGRRLDFLGIF